MAKRNTNPSANVENIEWIRSLDPERRCSYEANTARTTFKQSPVSKDDLSTAANTGKFTDDTFPVDLQLGDRFGKIEWKRPSEFGQTFEQPPCFVDKDGFSKFDVDQGKLGDCWFLAAIITVLNNRPDLFKAVVPVNQDFDKTYTGEFRFNFWSSDGWQTIEIDDRLPTRDGEPLFCRNRTNPSEQWPSLLEKAYAKFYGSYENINGGWTENAFVDFTGGMGYRISLKNIPSSLPDLYQHLLEQDQMKTLMGSSTQMKREEEEQRYGIIGGHAYGVTKVGQITDRNETKHQLIRLLNPWGSTEWKGAWSRNSTNWDNVDDNTKRPFSDDIGGKENGEFWMLYEDWLEHFDDLNICFLSPETTHERDQFEHYLSLCKIRR